MTEIAKRIPLLAEASERELEAFEQFAVLKTFAAGEQLAFEGDSCPYFFVVLKGRMRLAQEDLTGGLASFDQAFALRANVELALLSVKVLAQAGRLEETRTYLARAREANSRNGIARYSYGKDIEDWEKWLNSARMSDR